MVPVSIPFFVLILFRRNSVDDQVARIIPVQAADDIQQRCFPGTAGSQHGDEFTVPKTETDAVKSLLDQFAGLILFGNINELQHGFSPFAVDDLNIVAWIWICVF